MPSRNRLLPMVLGAVLLSGVSAPVFAAGDLDCKLTFEMSGWSVFYKTADGEGVVSCSNGARLPVRISSRGGGVTFGSSKIEDGRGEFSGIFKIDDVLGTYFAAEAHVGAVKSRQVQVVTKGSISLALVGKGTGWDIGVSLARFTLEPIDSKPSADEQRSDEKDKSKDKNAPRNNRR